MPPVHPDARTHTLTRTHKYKHVTLSLCVTNTLTLQARILTHTSHVFLECSRSFACSLMCTFSLNLMSPHQPQVMEVLSKVHALAQATVAAAAKAPKQSQQVAEKQSEARAPTASAEPQASVTIASSDNKQKQQQQQQIEKAEVTTAATASKQGGAEKAKGREGVKSGEKVKGEKEKQKATTGVSSSKQALGLVSEEGGSVSGVASSAHSVYEASASAAEQAQGGSTFDNGETSVIMNTIKTIIHVHILGMIMFHML